MHQFFIHVKDETQSVELQQKIIKGVFLISTMSGCPLTYPLISDCPLMSSCPIIPRHLTADPPNA